MHFLLHIIDRFDVERKSDEDASYDDFEISIHNDLTSLNQIMKELKSNRKIVSENKINRIEKIMQINNNNNRFLHSCDIN
jgi:hypothetical protein